jgi:hypothetical protein
MGDGNDASGVSYILVEGRVQIGSGVRGNMYTKWV